MRRILCKASILGVSLGIGLGVFARSGDARADDTTSYAGQTLLADGASVALVVGAVLVSDPAANTALGITGVASYALATPILHAAHGRRDAAFGSLLLRVLGVPAAGVIGVIVGSAACPDRAYDEPGQTIMASVGCLVYGGLIGVGVGAVTISTLDAIFLAREDVPSRAPPVAPKASLRLLPSLARGGAGIGVIGTF